MPSKRPRPKGTTRCGGVRITATIERDQFEWFADEAERLGIPLSVLTASALLEYRGPRLKL